MRSPEIGQVVVSPDDATDELLAAVQRAVETGHDIELGRRLRFKLWIAAVVHPLGIHHWVRYRTFDPNSGRIIIHPGRWVCAECPKGRVE